MTQEKEAAVKDNADKITHFQIAILFLSTYVLIALFIQTFFKIPAAIGILFDRLDFIVCIVFLFDVGLRFYKAENKFQFMKWGWIDLISSIPTVGILRWGRFARVFRLLRLLRAFRSARSLITFLFKNRAKGTLLSASLISILILILSSIAVLSFEDDPNSNIKTPGDALWWGIVTITTVGYGDKFPVTTEGRIAAVLLMMAGVGLFGTFTAYVASLFIEPEQKKEENEIGQLRDEIKLLHEKMDKLLENKKDQIL